MHIHIFLSFIVLKLVRFYIFMSTSVGLERPRAMLQPPDGSALKQQAARPREASPLCMIILSGVKGQ